MINVTYSVQQKTIDKKLITVTEWDFLSNRRPVPRVPLIRGGEGEALQYFILALKIKWSSRDYVTLFAISLKS